MNSAELKTHREAAIQAINRQAARIQQRLWHTKNKTTSTIQNILDLKNHQPQLSGFCSFAEHVMGWIPLNPNNIERVRAVVSVYHLPGESTPKAADVTIESPHPISNEYGGAEYELSERLPSRDGFLSLHSAITTGNAPLVYIGGKRGAGKTMALNFYLATAHRALMRKGVLWLRTDIAKIWAFPENFLTIAQYTVLHSIFVILHYANHDQSLEPLSDEGRDFQDYLDKLGQSSETARTVSAVWRVCLDSYRTAIRRAKADKNYKPVRDFLVILQRDMSSRGEGVYFELFSELVSYIRSKAISRGSQLIVLIILDGLDNVRIDAHESRYTHFLNEAIKMFAGFPIRLADKFVLVARPQTLMDLSFLRTAMPNGHLPPREFVVESDHFEEVIGTKRSVIRDPVEFFHTAANASLGRKAPTEESFRQFSKSVDFLLELLKRSRPVKSEKSIEMTFEPLQAVFDGNLRSLLRNAVRAHSHRMSLPGVSMRRTLLEGSVLAACPAMPGNFDENVHGHWCPNLFENASTFQQRWTGLSMLRLLQLLTACKDGITRVAAIEFLTQHFGYPETQVATDFQTASEFALLRSVGQELSTFDAEHARPRRVQRFGITTKGIYLLDLTFSDYAVMYFMSTNSPMYFMDVKESGVDYSPLVHSFREDRHFFRSAVISGTILWAHIVRADRQERSALKKTMRVSEVNIPSNAFVIVGLDNWPKLATSLTKKLAKRDLDVVRAWLNSYFEGLPYRTSLDV